MSELAQLPVSWGAPQQSNSTIACLFRVHILFRFCIIPFAVFASRSYEAIGWRKYRHGERMFRIRMGGD